MQINPLTTVAPTQPPATEGGDTPDGAFGTVVATIDRQGAVAALTSPPDTSGTFASGKKGVLVPPDTALPSFQPMGGPFGANTPFIEGAAPPLPLSADAPEREGADLALHDITLSEGLPAPDAVLPMPLFVVPPAASPVALPGPTTTVPDSGLSTSEGDAPATPPLTRGTAELPAGPVLTRTNATPAQTWVAAADTSTVAPAPDTQADLTQTQRLPTPGPETTPVTDQTLPPPASAGQTLPVHPPLNDATEPTLAPLPVTAEADLPPAPSLPSPVVSQHPKPPRGEGSLLAAVRLHTHDLQNPLQAAAQQIAAASPPDVSSETLDTPRATLPDRAPLGTAPAAAPQMAQLSGLKPSQPSPQLGPNTAKSSTDMPPKVAASASDPFVALVARTPAPHSPVAPDTAPPLSAAPPLQANVTLRSPPPAAGVPLRLTDGSVVPSPATPQQTLHPLNSGRALASGGDGPPVAPLTDLAAGLPAAAAAPYAPRLAAPLAQALAPSDRTAPKASPPFAEGTENSAASAKVALPVALPISVPPSVPPSVPSADHPRAPAASAVPPAQTNVALSSVAPPQPAAPHLPAAPPTRPQTAQPPQMTGAPAAASPTNTDSLVPTQTTAAFGTALPLAPLPNPVAQPLALAQPLPPMTHQVAHAVATAVSQGKSGQIEVAMRPEELGRIRFEMTTTGEKLHVILFVERPDSLDLMRRNADQLIADLRQSGFSNASLSFGGWGAQGQARPQAPMASALPDDGSFGAQTASLPPPTAKSATGGRLDIRL